MNTQSFAVGQAVGQASGGMPEGALIWIGAICLASIAVVLVIRGVVWVLEEILDNR